MNIYVGNLAYEATEDDIRGAFAGYGTVSTVTIIRDRFTGQPRGFGFVEMANDQEAEAAIQALNGQPFKGRNLTVNQARPRTDGGGGGGGGGGRGPRRGGNGGGMGRRDR